MNLVFYKIKIIAVCSFLICCWSLTGCRKFLAIDAPANQLVNSNTFSDNVAATAALMNIYTNMVGKSRDYSVGCGLSADELANYSSANSLIQLYTNNLSALSYYEWSDEYNYIYQANLIIEGLSAYKGVTPAVKNQLSCEALFIRAFWHFYLCSLYGDIPYCSSSDYKVNSSLTRMAKADVLQNIANDLRYVKQNVSADYVSSDDTSVSIDRVRPNKYAAAALLARVYLLSNKYDSAVMESTYVIQNDAVYSLDADLNNVFLANDQEAIWQLEIALPSNYNTPDGETFILKGAPGGGSVLGCCSISNTLMEAFEPGDLRWSSWVDSFSNSSSGVFYYPYKYKVYQSSTISEYVMMLRLAEQYLIRAEAMAYQEKIPEAVADINVIRKRAGLPDIAPASQTDVLLAVAKERRVELFSEWGHRWFDLKRTGAIDSTMSSASIQKGGEWAPYKGLWPIPQAELDRDLNLVQNSGY